MAKAHGKIPAHAEKKFSGVLFDVFQWQQTMFDGTSQTFERLRRPDTVQVIAVTDDKKIVMLNEQQPDMSEAVMSIPGGRLDVDGESPRDGAIRELLEETGYSAESIELWFEDRPVSKMEWTVYTFIARGCKKTQEPSLDAGEKIEMRLMSFDEFVQCVCSEEFTSSDDVARTIMRLLLSGKRAELEQKLLV